MNNHSWPIYNRARKNNKVASPDQDKYSANSNSFFNRMNRLFRSGPAIQKKIRGYDFKTQFDSRMTNGAYGARIQAPGGFGRENSPFSIQGQYGLLDRMSNYAEYSQMEYTSEIAASLDVLSEETVGGDDRGKSFHIYSQKNEIKKALDELFYETVNVEFNLRLWARNICKYGDFFTYNEVIPDVGVINVTPIPVNELEREEGFDLEDPYAVRYKWITRGSARLENWQVCHFRLLGNDLFLPYGTSVLEPAKRSWRQLTMAEDAMLIYRLVRAPDRRVFYVDVGNTAPNDIPSYMEQVKATMRSDTLIDKQDGRMDNRSNPLNILEDYFIPVRGQQAATKIETLAGGQNQAAIEDVQYLQAKMISALKVPKPYINFDDALSSKATLSQTDIRFSRTIAFIQKTIIAELNKLAMIHLYAKGFEGEDLLNFELKLSNPSSVALLQRLELWATKFEIGGNAKESGLADVAWIRKNILEFSDEEIEKIQKGVIQDKITESEIEQAAIPEEPVVFQRTLDPFDPENYNSLARNARVQKVPPHGSNGDTAQDIINRVETYDTDGNLYSVDLNKGASPIKASSTPNMNRNNRNRRRRVGQSGRENLAMPDFGTMLSPRKNKYAKDITGKLESNDNVTQLYGGSLANSVLMTEATKVKDALNSIQEPMLTNEIKSLFSKFDRDNDRQPKKGKSGSILTEEVELELDFENDVEQAEESKKTQASEEEGDDQDYFDDLIMA